MKRNMPQQEKVVHINPRRCVWCGFEVRLLRSWLGEIGWLHIQGQELPYDQCDPFWNKNAEPVTGIPYERYEAKVCSVLNWHL